MLYGCQHYVAHDVSRLRSGGRCPTHSFAVAAVQSECSAHRLAVIAPELKAIRTPSPVARIDSHAAFMAALRAWRHRLACQEQSMRAHDSVDALQVDRGCLARFALTTQQAPGTSVAVARQ